MEFGRFLDIAERVAVACEKMAEDPIVEMEIGPPVCPHCNFLNPRVNQPSTDGGDGRLFEFIAEFECLECGKRFIGVPINWSMHTSQDTLQLEIQGRAVADANLRGNQSSGGSSQGASAREDEAGPVGL